MDGCGLSRILFPKDEQEVAPEVLPRPKALFNTLDCELGCVNLGFCPPSGVSLDVGEGGDYLRRVGGVVAWAAAEQEIEVRKELICFVLFAREAVRFLDLALVSSSIVLPGCIGASWGASATSSTASFTAVSSVFTTTAMLC